MQRELTDKWCEARGWWRTSIEAGTYNSMEATMNHALVHPHCQNKMPETTQLINNNNFSRMVLVAEKSKTLGLSRFNHLRCCGVSMKHPLKARVFEAGLQCEPLLWEAVKALGSGASREEDVCYRKAGRGLSWCGPDAPHPPLPGLSHVTKSGHTFPPLWSLLPPCLPAYEGQYSLKLWAKITLSPVSCSWQVFVHSDE